jgi:hypothetical protein
MNPSFFLQIFMWNMAGIALVLVVRRDRLRLTTASIR